MWSRKLSSSRIQQTAAAIGTDVRKVFNNFIGFTKIPISLNVILVKKIISRKSRNAIPSIIRVYTEVFSCISSVNRRRLHTNKYTQIHVISPAKIMAQSRSCFFRLCVAVMSSISTIIASGPVRLILIFKILFSFPFS